jgi:hypothetical protein
VNLAGSRASFAVLALSLASFGLVPSLAAAQATPSIESLAAGLRSSDGAVREQAITTLRSLPVSEADAIADRIALLVRRAPDEATSDELLTAMRRATGSRRADDVVDVADGIAGVLSSRNDEPACRTAELILLARALEAHEQPAALLAAIETFRVAGSGWELEGHRFTLRLGTRIAGTALRALGHGDVHVREWARWTVHRLGIDAPGTFVRSLDPSVLADVLEAYGQARLMVAMPVVGSFVDAPQRTVREGAFAGLAAYGRNALWVIREAYELHAGADAIPEARTEWTAERTLAALQTVIDTRRLESARTALGDARAALDAGDGARAVELADAVLLARPELASGDIAQIYVTVAEQALERRDAHAARALLHRAERVADAGGDVALAARARGLLRYVHAEEALGAGVLDVDAYAAAALAVPDHAGLADLSARYSAPLAAPSDRTVPLGVAALISLLISVLLVTWRSTAVRAARPREAAPAPAIVADDLAVSDELAIDASLDSDASFGADEAPATLPG